MLPEAPNIGVSASFDFQVTLVNACDSAEFLPQTIPNLEVIMQNIEYQQTNFIQFDEFRYNPKANFNLDCGEARYDLMRLGSAEKLPSWIKGLSTSIQVNPWGTKMPI